MRTELLWNQTPAYYFDSALFHERVIKVKNALGEIPLTYSIKANPFLLNCLPDEIRHVEVCSPGELAICMRLQVPPERIIYSGVMKEMEDIHTAISYGADILTAESIAHAKMENEVLQEMQTLHGEQKKQEIQELQSEQDLQDMQAGMKKQKVILRLTSGNQFGMSKEDICELLRNQSQYPNLDFYGIHYYSGTQKNKMRKIQKDLDQLEAFLVELKDEFDYVPKLVEYGPGLAVDYFEEPYEETDEQLLQEAAKSLIDFSEKYPLGIEMGRFLAAPCGTYVTTVKDLKESFDTNYVICDGGMHHLKYHGQTMAMQVPPIWVKGKTLEAEKKPYCICGSLCTVADVLVREVELPELSVGDVIGFERCGAYSVTEGAVLFLSRKMPGIYLILENGKIQLLRDGIASDLFNCPN